MEVLYTTQLGTEAASISKSILILVDKSDNDQAKIVDKYMKEVFEMSKRSFNIKCNAVTLIKAIQYNEFSIANALVKEDFKKIGTIVLTNADFVPRLLQVLVRERYCHQPSSLVCESDPVEAALMIARCTIILSVATIGKSGISTLHVIGSSFKREHDAKLGGFMNKFK